MKAAWQSDIGKVRSCNEDFILADCENGIFLLADGMGGHRGGDVASALAARSAYAFLAERVGDTGEEGVLLLLAESLALAHSAVTERGRNDPILKGMGTTLDIVYLRGNSAWICHVGDSRVYLFRRGELLQVTIDDNLASVQVRQGVAPGEIPSGARHILTQAVGASAELVPELRHLDLAAGDILLMCSDGLSGMVPDDVVALIMGGSRDDLQKAADRLVKEANGRGGQDNASVILVAPQSEPSQSNRDARCSLNSLYGSEGEAGRQVKPTTTRGERHMNVIGINGSPRKKWNTATLVAKALEGAASLGATTELFHLYDLGFKGCISCFACKTRGGKSYGKCVLRDDLAPVLEKIAAADALVVGSPIYFGTVTGETRSFLERLLFPYLTYTVPYGTLFPKKIKTGFIYTMNVPEERSKEFGYEQIFTTNERYAQLLLGSAETLCAFDTCQVDDYSKVVIESFDPIHKANRRKEVLPLECRRAFELGQRLAGAETIAA